MFITFEGPDGSGKSTQIEYAKEYLTQLGYNVITTRDPGGTDLGVQLREILLNYDGHIAPLCEMCIFIADRAQHVSCKIIPNLKKGNVVLCDRFIDSTVAYQGYGRGLCIESINFMNNTAIQGLMPDMTLLFDLSVDTTMQRVQKAGSKDRLESELRDFHQRTIDGYREIAKNNPERFYTIDAEKPVEKVKVQVKKALDTLIAKRNK